MISDALLLLAIRLGRFGIQLRLVVNQSAVEFCRNFEKVPRLVTILLEANFVVKAINVFVLNNLDFDGFTRSHINKPERLLAMSKANKQKKILWLERGQDQVCTRSVSKVGSVGWWSEMFQEQVSSPVSHIREASVLKWIELLLLLSLLLFNLTIS